MTSPADDQHLQYNLQHSQEQRQQLEVLILQEAETWCALARERAETYHAPEPQTGAEYMGWFLFEVALLLARDLSS